MSGQDKSYLFGRASWFLLPFKNKKTLGSRFSEAVTMGCPVAISDQVYLSDYFHNKSEVLPVEVGWIEFVLDRMPDDRHREALIQLDRRCLIPGVGEAVTRDWAATSYRRYQRATRRHEEALGGIVITPMCSIWLRSPRSPGMDQLRCVTYTSMGAIPSGGTLYEIRGGFLIMSDRATS